MKYCVLGVLLTVQSAVSQATPFETCPSKAFLVQGNTASLFGVNLVSGAYTEFAPDVGTNNKVNGFGFSVHDRYLYGWDYSRGSLGKIGRDYLLESLDVSGMPNTNFYVGDVSVQTNAYYAYKKGADYGLFRISLDQANASYLQAQQVVNGEQLKLNIFDFAFHPDFDDAYSVDSQGHLHKINVTTGASVSLGNVGVSGTFGAVYFDVDANLYISRNQDGHIFKINLNDPTNPQLFAYGPSSCNDGARCATAPIIDESEPAYIDFGDAPNSYSTTLDANGARHSVGDLYLGEGVTAEYYPNNLDEDDGVSFLTSFETGLDSLISFNVSTNGYLNAWIDWDQNGVFSENEQALSGQAVNAGENRVLLAIPLDAKTGQTWARFRVSSQASVLATGGVDNGEVEDYLVSIVDSGVSELNSGWYTAAFEDLWPAQGDYDFNDVVVKYRVTQTKLEDQIIRFKVNGELLAVGASYHNAFAFRLKGVARNQVNESLIRHQINGQQTQINPLESGRSEAIMIVFDDTKTAFTAKEGCKYFRTESNCLNVPTVSFSITMPLSTPISDSTVNSQSINPFIFAVDGFYHGPLVDANNARGWEVHMKNQAPTEAFDSQYQNQAEDDSTNSGYFQTANGLPWGLLIGTEWKHPKESVDLLMSYPDFADFATSGGEINFGWFQSPQQTLVVPN